MNKHLSKLDSDERRVVKRQETQNPLQGLWGAKERVNTIISESGLYKLIMRSDKPEAREFQEWVTREVLPSIRKTGAQRHPNILASAGSPSVGSSRRKRQRLSRWQGRAVAAATLSGL